MNRFRDRYRGGGRKKFQRNDGNFTGERSARRGTSDGQGQVSYFLCMIEEFCSIARSGDHGTKSGSQSTSPVSQYWIFHTNFKGSEISW